MEDTILSTYIGQLANLDDSQFMEFFSDTLFWMKGEQIPFVKKYSEQIDPPYIPKTRDALKILMSKSLQKTVTSQGEFLGYLAELVGGEEALGGKKRFYVFLVRMETLKQIFVEESIRAQEKYLIDFNVNVEYVMGSSSFDNLEEYI